MESVAEKIPPANLAGKGENVRQELTCLISDYKAGQTLSAARLNKERIRLKIKAE